MLPISMTTQKLDALRSHNHVSKLYLSIYQPRVVLNALVNNASAARGDRTITFDNSGGTWANVESDMTLWVGSASGTFDLGKVRVKSATATTLTVAENDYINWQDNLYLTVVNYVDLVAIFPRLVQDTGDDTVVNFYKDYDVAYTNQNRYLGAFIAAGSHRAGCLDDNGRLNLFFSATGTYSMTSGSTMLYGWTFPAGVIVTGTAGQTPGIATFTGTGHYAIKLVVSTVDSVWDVQTTYRYVSVYDKPGKGTNLPIRNWTLSDLTGSRQDGGFRGKVNVFENINYKLDGGELVVIFSEDEFNGTPQQIDIGTVRPDDGILFVGYVLAGSIEYDYEKSKVSFDIGSASEVLKMTENFAISVESMASPSAWWQFYDMTTKKAMYHFIKWHSTLMKVADIFWLGKDYPVQFFDSERTNLWDAIQAFMRPTLLGSAVTNNKGQVVFQTEPESFNIPTASYPKIMDINDRDIVDVVNVEESFFDEVSYVEMGGICYDGALNGNSSAPMLSAAPGIAPKYYGRNQSNQGLALASQANLNAITGNVLAKSNADIQSFRARMAGNYRFTLAPLNMVGVYTPASRVVRNKMISGTFYADNINYNYSAQDGYLESSVEFLPVVNGTPGTTLEIKPPSILAPLTLPKLVLPSFSFGFGTNISFVVLLASQRGIWFTDNFDSDYPIWYSTNVPYVTYTNQGLVAADNSSTLRTMECNSNGQIIVMGDYGIYGGEVGSLGQVATVAQLVDDLGDYNLGANHPHFYAAGLSDAGAVCAVGGHPYGSRFSVPSMTALYGGSLGGLSEGEHADSAKLADIYGSATNSGGGWFITYGGYPIYPNIWLFSPDGMSIADGGSVLNGRTRSACVNTALPGSGIKYLHYRRDGAPATSCMTRCDEFDNESAIIDAGDSTEPRIGGLAISPSGAILRDGASGFRLSRDGGTTWIGVSGTLAWGAGSTDGACCSAKDDGAWIVTVNQAGGSVWYTPDNGKTWADKTGNLRNYLNGYFNILSIKAFL